MALIKERFQPDKLEEERTKDDIVNIRLNKHERIMLETLKVTFPMSHKRTNDSTVLKHFAFLFIKQQHNYNEIRRDISKL